MSSRPTGRWPGWALLSLGWLTWVGFLLAGARSGDRRLLGWAAVYLVLAGVSIAVSRGDGHRGAGLVILAIWVVGSVHALAVRAAAGRPAPPPPPPDPVRAARRRMQERERAVELARHDPELAREMGIGRPDRPAAAHGGVVDVNAVDWPVLTGLPGLDLARARELVRVREAIGGFSSLEDLGVALDLPGDRVEALRGRVVFLPYRPA